MCKAKLFVNCRGAPSRGRHADNAEQKRRAAKQINLIKEKINRGHTPENPVIKGRSVYNGRVQRGLYEKENTASPTVS